MEKVQGGFPVLLVDDEPQFLVSCEVVLRAAGISPVVTVEDGRSVLKLLEEREAAVVVLDLSMPKMPGMELLPLISERFPGLPVIMMTGTNEVEIAVECMKKGAFDYLVKPVEPSRFVSSVRRAIEVRSLREEVDTLKARFLSGKVRNEAAFAGIVTENRKMLAVFQYVEVIAASRHPVLITGETGTGKELLARSLHTLSGSEGSLVMVNVAGLDDTLFSDALFGHRKGAFTGADQAREGLIAQASGGTLFLDEIGDLRETSQVKLLRLLEERKYYPLGSDIARESDSRIVCATNHTLEQLVKEGKFRRDLYYRLYAHQIHLPPLRERKEDIPLLVDAFLAAAAAEEKKKKPTPPAELYTLLSTYDFPGNVRELRMMVFDAVLRHTGGILSIDSFRRMIGVRGSPGPEETAADVAVMGGNSSPFKGLSRLPTLKEAEEQLVAEALARSRNNQGIAASMLGISRQAMNKRLIRKAQGGQNGNDAKE